MKASALRIGLIDDHVLFREGLRALFALRDSIAIVGQATNVREALTLARSTPMDVAIVDVSLPDVGGASFTRELKDIQPACAVLALSMHAELEYVVAMLQAGANGYAVKSQDPDAIVDAITAVSRGERYLAPALPSGLIDQRLARGAGVLAPLSAREREVFALLVKGFTNERIAGTLFIAARTVESHRAHMMRKLDVRSIVELVRFAARHSLLEV